MNHGDAPDRRGGAELDESHLLEAGPQRHGRAHGEPIRQFNPCPHIYAEHHVLAADVVEQVVFRNSTAILRAEAAESSKTHAESPGNAKGAKILGNGRSPAPQTPWVRDVKLKACPGLILLSEPSLVTVG